VPSRDERESAELHPRDDEQTVRGGRSRLNGADPETSLTTFSIQEDELEPVFDPALVDIETNGDDGLADDPLAAIAEVDPTLAAGVKTPSHNGDRKSSHGGNGAGTVETMLTSSGIASGRRQTPVRDDPVASAAFEALADLEQPKTSPGVVERDGAPRPQRASKLRLGEILLEMSLATAEQIESAIGRQKETRKRLGQLLVEDGVLTELDLTKALAAKFGVSFLDLTQTQLDASAAGLISDKLARRYGAIPIKYLDESTLLVAMVDPQNLLALEDLRIMTGYDIQAAIASEEDVFGAIAKLNRMEGSVAENDEEKLLDSDDSIADIRESTEEAPIVKLVNSVIAQSVDDGASDIHFEPQAKELVVRFRIDGVLHEVMSVPRRMQNGVISRLKIMADLDIAERRVPQDGRIGLVVGGKPIDMRVATLPTVYGEKIVMRLLDKSNVMLNLEDLGFAPKALKRFHRSFTKPYGAILVTGPTGSGKSTTLYAALNILNSPEKNIITVEDPVEYRLTGINQVQVNTKAGMTFAAALRSILRCDPDIVMIGEIRDRETATIAIESALTGHLVLSTLHTNDAPGALSRLTEMGIEPFLTSSAVDCVLAQRLARRLCSVCKEPFTATKEMLRKNDFPPEVQDRDDVVLYKAKGCSRCNGTGYKGRLGLYEVMVVSEAIRRLTVERKSADEISRVAAAEGMKSLREDGIDKVLLGMTAVEEIARVII
jgi:type IV pilus assembly protein PilB